MQQIELCENTLCTGCGACMNVCPKSAITMHYDDEGFQIPIINRDACVECGLCQKVCPIINKQEKKFPSSPLVIYAGYIKDEDIRKNSASGGAFPGFANKFYSRKNGMVVAASFDEHLNLRHTISTKKSDLIKFQGSKYLQSEIGFVFKDILNSLKKGVEILFVGTPCQVAGLKSFLRKDYENLLTVDLICHGVPSPRLFKSYLVQVGVSTKNEYKDFFFRSRNDSAFFLHSLYNKNGSIKVISPDKHSFICAYLKGWVHRESCYRCPFAAIPRQGDCTIADFWGILAGKVPFAGDRSKGVSLIMLNNQKGLSFFEKIKNDFYLEEKSIEEAKIDNHNLYTHDERPDIRDTIYGEMYRTPPKDLMKKYNLRIPVPPSIWKRIKSRIVHILGL